MKCPNCDFEERDRLLSSPCPKCAHEWWDTEDFVRLLAPRDCKRVMDVGCGNKGVIAEAFWREIGIEKGYAVDIHVVKDLPEPWGRCVDDVENVLDAMMEVGEQLDFITFCGLLEHLEYSKAFRVIEKMLRVLRPGGGLFCTASAVLREVDYKVRQDGNPHHKYVSFWCGPIMRALGFVTYDEMMRDGSTFIEEIIASKTNVVKPSAAADGIKTGGESMLRDGFFGRGDCCGCVAVTPVLWMPGVGGGDYYCGECARKELPEYAKHPPDYFGVPT